MLNTGLLAHLGT